MLSARDETCRHSTRHRLQNLETQFLSRNAELHQFGLIDPNGIVVGLSCVVNTVFQVLYVLVLAFNGVLDLSFDFLYHARLQSCALDQLMQLSLFLF